MSNPDWVINLRSTESNSSLVINVYELISACIRFKGSMTHLQAHQISMSILLQVASDISIRIILRKVYNSKPFSLEQLETKL